MVKVTFRSEAGAARVDLFKRETRRDPVWLTAPARRVLQRERGLDQMLAQGRSPRTELLAAGLWNLPVVEMGDLAPRVVGSVVIDLKEEAAAIGQDNLLGLMVGWAGTEAITLTPYLFPATDLAAVRRDIFDWWQGRGGLPLPVDLPVGRGREVIFARDSLGNQGYSLTFSAERSRTAATINVLCEEFGVGGRVNRLCHADYYAHSKRAIVSAGSVYLVHEGRVFENPVRPEELAKGEKPAYPTHDREAFEDFMQEGGSLPEGFWEISATGHRLLLGNISGDNPIYLSGFKPGRYLIKFVRKEGGKIQVWVYNLREELLKKFILRDSRYHYGALEEV